MGRLTGSKLAGSAPGRVERRGASQFGKVPDACCPIWTHKKLSGKSVRLVGRDTLGVSRHAIVPVEALEILADPAARLADIRWARMKLVVAWHGSHEKLAKELGVEVGNLRVVITGAVYHHIMQERLDLEFARVQGYISGTLT